MRRARNLTAIAGLALLTACATRAVSPGASEGAASPTSAAPEPARVGQVLREDPPLPGESTLGWEGLDAPAKPILPTGAEEPGSEGEASPHGDHHGH